MPHKDPEKRKEYRRRYVEQHRAECYGYNRTYKRECFKKDPLLYVRRNLWLKYGITLEEYQMLHDSQKGLCAICDQPETRVIRGKVTRLMVDHDHKTKKNRKLLCGRCNTLLGMAKENVKTLRAAIAYLEDLC